MIRGNMDNHETFLRAIIAAPLDDLPRLNYADFLERLGETAASTEWHECCRVCNGSGDALATFGPQEYRACPRCKGTGEQVTKESNGHAERAEFIRVQCELAKMPIECDFLKDSLLPLNKSQIRVRGLREATEEEFDRIYRCDNLRRRERELLQKHGIFWLGFYPPTAQFKGEGLVASVGF